MRPLLSAFIASTSLLDVAMVRRVIMASMAALVSSRPAVSERCRCAIKGFAEFKLRRFQHEIHGGTESCHPQRLEHEEQCDVEARNLSVPRAGHQVVFGVRSPSPDRSEERTIPESIREADAAILAVPFGAVADVIKGAGSLAGKVLIDATNPLGMVEGGLGLTMGFSSSGAERIAALAPGAFVFKAFNQTGFEKTFSGLMKILFPDGNATAAEIHQIGLDEVKRDEAEMLVIAKQLGFQDLKSFQAFVKTDPKLKPTSREQILDALAGLDDVRVRLPARRASRVQIAAMMWEN